LKEIIETYKSGVKAIIKNLTGKHNEDIEQEVYLRAWKNLDKYDETGKFRQWISTITANICKDYLKSSYNKNLNKFTTEEETTQMVADSSDVSDILEEKFRQKKIAKAIYSLPKKLQETIVLYEIEGYDYETISKTLKCPIGTVKSRIFKARQELYEMLKDII
jgi:RNA polymerase sigma-70 factor (ECF subfamily)